MMQAVVRFTSFENALRQTGLLCAPKLRRKVSIRQKAHRRKQVEFRSLALP